MLNHQDHSIMTMTQFFYSRLWRMSLYLLMLITLFTGAYVPKVGAVAWRWHVEAHFLSFLIVGLMTSWALSQLRWFWQVLLVMVIPLAHETCEIWGHVHRLEVHDIYIDIAGGLCGVLLAHLLAYGYRRIHARAA